MPIGSIAVSQHVSSRMRELQLSDHYESMSATHRSARPSALAWTSGAYRRGDPRRLDTANVKTVYRTYVRLSPLDATK